MAIRNEIGVNIRNIILPEYSLIKIKGIIKRGKKLILTASPIPQSREKISKYFTLLSDDSKTYLKEYATSSMQTGIRNISADTEKKEYEIENDKNGESCINSVAGILFVDP